MCAHDQAGYVLPHTTPTLNPGHQLPDTQATVVATWQRLDTDPPTRNYWSTVFLCWTHFSGSNQTWTAFTVYGGTLLFLGPLSLRAPCLPAKQEFMFVL